MIFICLCNKLKHTAYVMTFTSQLSVQPCISHKLPDIQVDSPIWKKERKKCSFLECFPNSDLKKAEGLKSSYPRQGSRTAHPRGPFPLASWFNLYITSLFPWAAVPDMDEEEEPKVPADCRSSLITHQCHKEW